MKCAPSAARRIMSSAQTQFPGCRRRRWQLRLLPPLCGFLFLLQLDNLPLESALGFHIALGLLLLLHLLHHLLHHLQLILHAFILDYELRHLRAVSLRRRGSRIDLHLDDRNNFGHRMPTGAGLPVGSNQAGRWRVGVAGCEGGRRRGWERMHSHVRV